MATLTELGQGLAQAWNQVVEGWRSLTSRAGEAITRFNPLGRDRDDEQLPSGVSRSVGWGVLAAELWEDGDRVVVRLEAPGMKKSDFDIEIMGDYLVIRGEKHSESESRHGRYHVVECAYGAFERAVPLPGPVDRERVRAKYRRGVLRIELPLKPGSGGARRIPIR